MGYFDTLVVDISKENPTMSKEVDDIEIFRRIMYILKASIDGKPIIITSSPPNWIVQEVNSAFLTYTGYTKEEALALDDETLIDSRDFAMFSSIRSSNVAAPYIVRVIKKGGAKKFCKVRGLTVTANGISWRFLIFLELDVTLA